MDIVEFTFNIETRAKKVKRLYSMDTVESIFNI